MDRWLYQNCRKIPIGRQLVYRQESLGKRHYWGYKGKDYGFFTTEEQDNMMTPQYKNIKNHRSLTQHKNGTLNSDQQRYKQHLNQSRSFHKRYHTENVIEASDEINPQHKTPTKHPSSKLKIINTLNDKLIQSPSNYRRNLKLDSPNMQISLPQINRQDMKIKEELEANQRELQKLKIRQMRQIKISQKFNNRGRNMEQNIFFYSRKNRKMNPTFCNSYMYPLPYYQHV